MRELLTIGKGSYITSLCFSCMLAILADGCKFVLIFNKPYLMRISGSLDEYYCQNNTPVYCFLIYMLFPSTIRCISVV